jgi:hypothetical protein
LLLLLPQSIILYPCQLSKLRLFRNQISDLAKVQGEISLFRPLSLYLEMSINKALGCLVFSLYLFLVLGPQIFDQLLLFSVKFLIDTHIGLLLDLYDLLHYLTDLFGFQNFVSLACDLLLNLLFLKYLELLDLLSLLFDEPNIL